MHFKFYILMYTDLLVKIKNAQGAGKERIKVPFSNMDMAIAEILAKHRFVETAEKKGRMPKRIIELRLKYDEEKRGAIRGFQFLSKRSRRLYSGYRDLRPVRQGYGLLVLSTPQGIRTSQGARKEKVGGETLFKVW